MSEAKRLLSKINESFVYFDDLPEDLQVWITQFMEEYGDEAAMKALQSAFQFHIANVPISSFPIVSINNDPFDSRDELYATDMIGADVPPVVVCCGDLVDGRHRIWAARKAGLSHVPTISLDELSDIFQESYGVSDCGLGPVKSFQSQAGGK